MFAGTSSAASENVTVLFTDMVGSTALASSLTPARTNFVAPTSRSCVWRPHWLLDLVNYADVCVACRDTEIAAAMLDRLEPVADQVPTNILSARDPVRYFLGNLATLLGRYDDADDCFALADQFNRRAGAKFFAANTDLAWGSMLVERDDPGDRERARDLINHAHAAAVTHGYPDIARRAVEALEHLDQH